MNTGPDLRTWRFLLRSSCVKLAVGLALLMLAVVASLVYISHDEPSFRGRSAHYWSRAFRAATDEQGNGISYGGHQDWTTRLSISIGIRHEDRDLLDLLYSDDPERVAVLIELLRDPDPRVRRHVATTVGWMKQAPKAMLPALILASHDQDVKVRAGAVHALGSIGPDAEAAVPDLIQALDDSDRDVRSYALYSLRQIGPGARPAIPALIRALTYEDDHLKGWAAYALEAIGPEARIAVPLIAELLKNKDFRISDPGYNALAKLDPQALAEAMRWR